MRKDHCAERAFTILELVVIVLIVGLLATIAIPRFRTYRARAAQSEMKTNLGNLARSQKVYMAEGHSYTDDLGRMGWVLEGAPVYLYGFTTDALPAASGRNDTAELRAAGIGTYRTGKMVDAFGNPLTDASLPTAPVSEQAFTAGAAANLDDDAVLDKWTLSSAGVLSNIVTDLN